jgi:hypothetical protein
MHTDEPSANQLTERIIGCPFRVLNGLGAGFLEKVYENALAHELRKFGLVVVQQQGISVMYVELKAIKNLDTAHTAQCINYLKATGLHRCLLLNFGKPRLEIQRIAHGP